MAAKQKILIVDDDNNIAELISLYLTKECFDTKMVHDGESALKEFETYAPMITGHAPIPKGKQASYERNRNLFYVCCSRPKKRLIFFVTVPIDSTFKSFLVELVGEQNIFTFSQYIERKSIK